MKPGKFRFRSSFSLRTFLVALTLLSIVICLFANRTRRRQAALAKLHSLGVSTTTAYGHRMSKGIFLIPGYVPPPVSRTWSEVIFGDGLDSISIIRQTRIPGDMLRAIASFPELRSLYLHETDVGDQDLRVLRGLRNLESLNLTSSAISDASAEVIGGFREMKWLELNETNITDEAVPHLMRLQKLEVLRVRHTNFTEQGILQLASLPNLKEIHYGQPPGAARPFQTPPYELLRTRFPQLSISNW